MLGSIAWCVGLLYDRMRLTLSVKCFTSVGASVMCWSPISDLWALCRRPSMRNSTDVVGFEISQYLAAIILL